MLLSAPELGIVPSALDMRARHDNGGSPVLTDCSPGCKPHEKQGFHVHIDVFRVDFAGLKRICQNFVKFEAAFDWVFPVSTLRRKFAKSIRRNGFFSLLNNRQANQAIESCETLDELCHIINPGGDRAYMLNLQNLPTERQSTIEFRQHFGTLDADEVSSWVHLLQYFVARSVADPSRVT